MTVDTRAEPDTVEVTVDLARWATAPRVTAVLVAHDGSAFLPRALAALRAQKRAPDVTVAVDTGSQDTSAALLDAAPGLQVVHAGSVGFRDAVSAALTAADDPAGSHASDRSAGSDSSAGSDGSTGSWIWLLHDDTAPAPDALERLLAAVETAPSVAVAGCKQVSWDDGQRLLQVGFSTSRLGSVVTGMDRGEVDQGQHDLRSDVLAVATSGMLVRRDVWDALGGPDPALSGARADLDLCRRARLAGHRVVVVPGAVVAHAAAGATRRRPGSSWYRDDRRDALFLRLTGVAPALVVPALVWSSVAAVLRFAFRLVLKQPGQAIDELSALAWLLGRPDRWLRSRRSARAGRTVPPSALRPLRPTLRQLLRLRRDEVAAWIVPADRRATTGAHTAPSGPTTGGLPLSRPAGSGSITLPTLPRKALSAQSAAAGAESAGSVSRARPAAPVVSARPVAAGPALGSPAGSFAVDAVASPQAVRLVNLARRAVAAGPALLVAALAAAWAGRRVLTGTGAVVGPYLAPAPDTAQALRLAASASWRAVGLGAAGLGDPLNRVLADGSLLVGGDPGRLVAVLLVGAPVLAALTAWVAVQAVTTSWAVRTWVALGWAGAPPLLAAALSGRPGAVVVHVLLPLLALALARCVLSGSVAAAAAAGLVLTVVLAAAPGLTLAALAALLLLAGTAALLAGPARSLLLLLTAAVPGVVLLPWWVAVVQRPALLLADPALATSPGAGSTASGAAGWRLLLLPGSPGDLFDAASRAAGPAVHGAVPALFPGQGAARLATVLAVLVVLPTAVLAVAALLRRHRSGAAAVVCWSVVLTGLGLALVGKRASSGVRAWPGPALSVAALGLFAAALVVVPAIANRLRGRSFGVRHLLTAGIAVLCALAPLVALAGFAWQGWAAGQVHRARVDVLPAVATAEARGPAAIRTLVLSVDPQRVRWTLADADGARLGDDSAAAASPVVVPAVGSRAVRDAALVTPAVAALLSDSVQDVRTRLADLAVGSVVLLPPVDDAAQQALDNAPGLVRVATSSPSLMWRVEPPTVGAAGSRPSRVRILAPNGSQVLAALPATRPTVGLSVDTTVSPGPPGRRVVLAERADGGWHAALDGVALERTTYAGWAQAFTLPAAGGHLEVVHSAGLAGELAADLGWLRVLVLGLALLIAAPLPRVSRRVAAPAPARRSRPVVRDPLVLFPAPMPPAPRVFGEEHPEDGEIEPMLAELPLTRRQRIQRRMRRLGRGGKERS